MAIFTTLPYYVTRSNDIQQKEGCCDISRTELEDAIGSFYKTARPWMDSLLGKIKQKECFGFLDGLEDLYNDMNDFHYLGLYLTLMYSQREEDNRGVDCDDRKLGSEYTEFDCLKAYFACKGINIDPLLTIFGFGLPDDCGINYMCIEEANDDCDCPIFQANIDC